MTKNYTHLNSLVERLRHRLKNFAVINQHGEKVGEVKDLILDANRQLRFVISHMTHNNSDSRLFLLVSKLIQKIEPANKAVLVDINIAEIENLPEYTSPGTNTEDVAIPLGSSRVVMAHTNQHDRFNYASPSDEPTDVTPTQLFKSPTMQNEIENNNLASVDTEALGEEIIRLLGERLVVERSKRKIGEIVIRKEIETRMVQVPVRYEKLIVEQVGAENKQLAEIDLGGVTAENDLPDSVIAAATAAINGQSSSQNGGLTVSGKFNSPKIASLLLNAIAMERRHGCKQVRIEIVVEDTQQQQTYQEWFERISVK